MSALVNGLYATAAVIGAIGGAGAFAAVVKRFTDRRRLDQRREDALWGWDDDDGTHHTGFYEAGIRHIDNRSIHVERRRITRPADHAE